MSTPSKHSIKKLVTLVGIASASTLLSLPAFALINHPFNSQNNSAESHGEIPELLAQGGSGDQGDDGLNNEQLPATGGNLSEPVPTDSNNNQMPPTVPTMENNGTNGVSSGGNNNGTGNQYTENSDRLQPGNWFCINNPNPQCES